MENTISTVGPWAKEKLECLHKYLSAYTTIMAKQSSWCRGFVYVDAFAGPGHHHIRQEVRDKSQVSLELELVSEYQLNDAGQQEYIKGSPRVALELEHPFTKYHFAELCQDRLSALGLLRQEFNGQRTIDINAIDCNDFLLRKFLPEYDWRKWRAIVFLDPFGKQVPWETIQALAHTGAIEIFLNLPVWMAIQRFLNRRGVFSEAESKRLDQYFGTPGWRDLLYEQDSHADLFGGPRRTVKVKNSGRLLVSWYRDRLREIFGYVSSARVIKSVRGRPLYCLIHASHNKAGGKIADDVLRQGEIIR